MAQTQLLQEKPTTQTTIVQVKEDPAAYNKQTQETKKNQRTDLLKRIPLEKLMDLKIDFAFKQLFGNEKNKAITIVFLNAILQKTGRNRIIDVTFLNTDTGREYAEDKESRFDLLVLTNTNEKINVEIQFNNKYDMVKRSIFYWSGIYRSQLKSGMEYNELRPVIAINILNYDMIRETDRFHTSFHLQDTEEYFKLTNLMEFHFIEMTKLIRDWKANKLDPWNDVLARWLLMLGMVDRKNDKTYHDIYKELEAIAMIDKTFHKAFEHWEDLSMTQEQYLAYESRLKDVLDEESYRKTMERKEQEIEQGMKVITEGKKEITEGKKEITEGKKEITEGKKEITEGKKEITEGKKEITEGKKEITEGKKEIMQGQREITKGMEEVTKEKKDNEEKKQKIEQEKRSVEQRKINLEQKEKSYELRLEAAVRELLLIGKDIEFVAKTIGLNVEKVKEIQSDMEK